MNRSSAVALLHVVCLLAAVSACSSDAPTQTATPCGDSDGGVCQDPCGKGTIDPTCVDGNWTCPKSCAQCETDPSSVCSGCEYRLNKPVCKNGTWDCGIRGHVDCMTCHGMTVGTFGPNCEMVCPKIDCDDAGSSDAPDAALGNGG